MTPRRHHRTQKLLRLRRRQERIVATAVSHADGLAQATRTRLAELESRLDEQNRIARDRLLGPADAFLVGTDVGPLLIAIAQRRGELLRREDRLHQCRAELAQAATRRKAVELLERKQASQRLARRMRTETDRLDDAHAARAAVEETSAT